MKILRLIVQMKNPFRFEREVMLKNKVIELLFLGCDLPQQDYYLRQTF